MYAGLKSVTESGDGIRNTLGLTLMTLLGCHRSMGVQIFKIKNDDCRFEFSAERMIEKFVLF